MENLYYDIKTADKYIILTLCGELTINNSQQCLSLLQQELDLDRVLILDLKKFTYIDSSGLTVIINLSQELIKKNLHLYAYNLSEKMGNIFRMVGLLKFVKILDAESVKKLFTQEQ